jgi:tRNA(Phe) wybutosine-synthesizing methylase Tyw3
MEGIDETIAPLIEAMNKVPYLATLSCCGGHPEESAVKEYSYAIATVVFDVEDEAENAIRWYDVVQDILSRRKAQQLSREHARSLF